MVFYRGLNPYHFICEHHRGVLYGMLYLSVVSLPTKKHGEDPQI